MSKSLRAQFKQFWATYSKNEHIFCIKQIQTSYPVTAKQHMSINNKIARAVTGQSLISNLKHLSVDYDHCDGLYAATVGMNTNVRQ